jgi:serine/threonine protein kinase
MADFEDSLKYEFTDLYKEAVETKAEDSECPIYDSLEMIFDNYVDFEEIGRGGMKHIFKVLDKRLNRYVALAKLPIEMPKAFYDSFIREARITALLEHPNIISIHDIGLSDDRTPFFTMELKVGENLGAIIKKSAKESFKGAISQEEILQSFIKVCDAISYAHSKEVLHLDLKPDNIQLGGFGEVVVCDWGLGKIIGNEDNVELDQVLFNPDLLNGMTLADEIKGTPGYMAPEQIEASGEKTKLTDIYSLGALLYSILTGKSPFRGEVETIIKNTREGKLIPPCERELEWYVPNGLNAVVLKAMSLKPESRYQSVEQLQNEVANYLVGRTTVAEKAGPTKEALLFYKRNKVLCNTALGFFFILLLVGGGFLMKLKAGNALLIEQRDRAENSQKLAEDVSKKNHQEKRLLTALMKDPKIRQIITNTDNIGQYQPIKALAEAMDLLNEIDDLHHAYMWGQMQKGYVHLLRQELHEANRQFAVNSINADDLFELSKKFERYGKEGELLPGDILGDLLVHMMREPYSFRRKTAFQILRYDAVKRVSTAEHSKAVFPFLRRMNISWENSEIKYDPLKKILAIHGKFLHKLSYDVGTFVSWGGNRDYRVSVLYGLKLKELDVSRTSIKDFNELLGLDIERLDIRYTAITDLSPAVKLTYLKVITIHEGQFSKEQLTLLPSQVKVIIK